MIPSFVVLLHKLFLLKIVKYDIFSFTLFEKHFIEV